MRKTIIIRHFDIIYIIFQKLHKNQYFLLFLDVVSLEFFIKF